MPVIIARFLFPYASVFSNISWNIMQNLEGAGILSSSVPSSDLQTGILVSTWSPQAKVYIIMGIITLAFLAYLPLLVLSGYSLNKWNGVFVVSFLVFLPGLLAVVGLWPATPLQPEKYEIGGAGVVGYVGGLLPLALLMVLVGWSLIIVSVDSFRLGKKFIDAYDHLWLMFGLVALVFFVMDAQITNNTRDYNEANSTIQRANSYLLKQIETYGQWCMQTSNNALISCRWASDVHQRLLDASITGLSIGQISEMKSTAEIYSQFGQTEGPEKVLAIRHEIIAYNKKVCPVIKLNNGNLQLPRTSIRCQTTPSEFCTRFPDPLDGVVDNDIVFTPVALATECIIPELVYQQNQGLLIFYQQTTDKVNKNYRLMYYLFFMIVLGGKVATTSVKLVGMEGRLPDDTQRAITLCQVLILHLWTAVKFPFQVISIIFGFTRKLVHRFLL